MVESLIAFNAVLLAALLSPGAAMLYALKTSVSSGRATGIAVGLGLGTAAAGWTIAALVGLESLFLLFPWTYTALKIGGACYLLYLAWQTWRHASTPLAEAAAPRARTAIFSGFLVNLGNPKSMLFAAAVIVVVFPQGLSPQQIALIVANHWLLEATFYTLFALLLGSAPARRSYLGLKPIFDRIAATLLGALGVRLLLERS